MNKVAGFLTLCLVVAVLRALVVALVVAMIIALLWSFITRPRETLLLVVTVTMMAVASARPLAFIATVGAIALASLGVESVKQHRRWTGHPAALPGLDVASGN